MPELSLHDFQLPVADAAAEVAYENGSALLTCPTGWGKMYAGSYIASQFQDVADMQVRVICPKIAIPAWNKVLAGFGVTDRVLVTNYEKAFRHWVEDYPWKKFGRETWPQWKEEHLGGLIIFDESHRCGGRDTLNAKMLTATRGRAHSIQMTATPGASPMRMRALMTTLGIITWSGFWRWIKQNGCYRNPWDGYDFTKSAKKGKEYMRAINKVLYPKYGPLVSMADCAKYYNENHVYTECIPVKGVNEAYARAIEEVEERGYENEYQMRMAMLGARIKVRRDIEVLKVPALVDLAKDGLESGYSVVVFVNFTPARMQLQKALKGPAIYGTDEGGKNPQKPAQRQEVIDGFNSGKYKCIIVNYAAGGEAVSLHDTVGDAPRLVLHNPPENPTHLSQAIGRVWRVGGASPATQKLVFAADSLEEVVAKNVNRKLGNIDALTENELQFF